MNVTDDTEKAPLVQETEEKPEETSEMEKEDLAVMDLRPKPPTNRCPQGIRTFTVCRQADQSGVSGEGIVAEGAVFATGAAVIHWLTPPPRGSVAMWDSIGDFIKIHIKPHPGNKTIITYDDGETETY